MKTKAEKTCGEMSCDECNEVRDRLTRELNGERAKTVQLEKELTRERAYHNRWEGELERCAELKLKAENSVAQLLVELGQERENSSVLDSQLAASREETAEAIAYYRRLEAAMDAMDTPNPPLQPPPSREH